MASIDHLHSEAKILPIADHLSLLSTQFLASALRPHHPYHQIVTAPPGPRQMKPTLQSKFLPTVAHHLQDNIIHPEEYEEVIKDLHTSAVQRALSAQGPNRVLGTSPPPISNTELALPRHYRTTLSQLRSGHCTLLRSYQARVGRAPDPMCPACHSEEQTTAHLFNCEETVTTLQPRDLWNRPCAVAEFLAGLPFLELPPLPRPPPEPPPGGD